MVILGQVMTKERVTQNLFTRIDIPDRTSLEVTRCPISVIHTPASCVKHARIVVSCQILDLDSQVDKCKPQFVAHQTTQLGLILRTCQTRS